MPQATGTDDPSMPHPGNFVTRRIRRLSLQARVLGVSGVVLALVLFTDAALRQSEIETAGRLGIAERARLLASIQSKALSVPMWDMDHTEMGAALDALAADPDFVAASLMTPQGKVLGVRGAVAALSAEAGGASALVRVARVIRFARGNEVRTLGLLKLALSTDRLRAQMRGELLREAESFLALQVSLLLLLFVALRQFTRPLDLLAGALKRLAAGDRETPIPALESDNEVGNVARALNVFRDTAFRLVKAEGNFRVLFESSPIGIYGADEAGIVTSANDSLLRLAGYSTIASLAQAMARRDGTGYFVSHEHKRRLWHRLLNEGGFAAEICEVRRGNGELGWISITARAVRDETGRVLGYTGTIEDITEQHRRADEERLRVRAAIESASDAILILDTGGGILFANPALERSLGYRVEELSKAGGLPMVIIDPATSDSLARALRSGGGWQGEADVQGKDGHVVPLQIRVSAIRDEEGAWFGAVAICSDLTVRREAEARVQRLALYDSLTGMPNRVLFRERLHAALAGVDGHAPTVRFAVLYLDLDRFKAVNDLLGHACGDRLLQQAAARLYGVVREGDTVARVGGDEFVVIQLGITQPEQAVSLAERLVQELSQAFHLDGREALIGASVGIALAPLHSDDPDRLLAFADVALYDAKLQGRRQVRVFTPDMDRRLRNRAELERDLRRAFEEKALHLQFQPQYHLGTGSLAGAEALLRWTDPMRGVVSPTEFIPIAEECGLINGIGQWVLQSACAEAASWPGGLRIAVNVSPIQFHTGNLFAVIERVLAETGLDPARLELEVTEGVLLLDSEQTRTELFALKSLGVRISLDDFGTGYSSLSYLRRMPLDKIKIDRSFIMAIGHDAAATALVRSIIGLAKGLGLVVNAEGVETEAQAQLLREEGCDEVQGFHFARPMAGRDFTKLLAPRLVSQRRVG
jgi:diguanylate cyclase (GGDEF)-like protein/PAS domain S-box-containing protein